VGVSRSAKSYKSRLFGSPQNSKNFPCKASWTRSKAFSPPSREGVSGVFKSVADLEDAIKRYIDDH
jgi:hypothetical protein